MVNRDNVLNLVLAAEVATCSDLFQEILFKPILIYRGCLTVKRDVLEGNPVEEVVVHRPDDTEASSAEISLISGGSNLAEVIWILRFIRSIVLSHDGYMWQFSLTPGRSYRSVRRPELTNRTKPAYCACQALFNLLSGGQLGHLVSAVD